MSLHRYLIMWSAVRSLSPRLVLVRHSYIAYREHNHGIPIQANAANCELSCRQDRRA
jgi:hypothetical protein